MLLQKNGPFRGHLYIHGEIMSFELGLLFLFAWDRQPKIDIY